MRKLLCIVGALLVLAGSPGWGAIAHDQDGNSGATTGTISSWTMNVTTAANAGIIIYTSCSSAVSISSITVAGGAFTFTHVASVTDSSNSRDLECFYGFTTASLSAAVVTINLSASNSAADESMYTSFTGTSTTTVVEASNAVAQTAQSTYTGSITTLTANAEVMMAGTSASIGLTAGTGYTVSSTNSGGLSNTSLMVEYKNAVTASPSTVSPTMSPLFGTQSGTTLSISIAPPGAATTNHNKLLLMGVG